MTAKELINELLQYNPDAVVEVALQSRINPSKYMRRQVMSTASRKAGRQQFVMLRAFKSLSLQHQIIKSEAVSGDDFTPTSWPDMTGWGDNF